MIFGPKFATLIFTDTSIKAAAAKPTTKGFKISYLAKKSLPPQTVVNGTVTNQSIFREVLKTFYLENFDKLKTKTVVLGLNEEDVFLTNAVFEKKPRHLAKILGERISKELPFSLNKASLLYSETSRNVYQVVAAKTETLRLLTSVIEDSGFSLKAIVPLPLIFPKLVGQEDCSYLIIASEEDLIYSLVVKNAVAFTSTIHLKKPPLESEKEIIMRGQEIIQLGPEKGFAEPMKDVFVYGKGAEFLKSFFNAKGFKTEIVLSSDESSKRTGYDIADFSRTIALSVYDSSILAFPRFKISREIKASSPPPKKGQLNPTYMFLPLLIIAAFTIFIFWPTLKDIFLPGASQQNILTPPKEATTSATKQPKEAPPAAKKEAPSSSQTKEEINKKDLKIQILNGSGKAGSADEMRDFLVTKGYVVESVGNADHFNYKTTQIQVKNSKSQITDLLTKDLKERYSINTGSPLLEEGGFDIIIIVGGE